VVASLPRDQQREALAQIAANRWSVRTAHAKLSKPGGAGGATPGHSARPRADKPPAPDAIQIPVARYRWLELLEEAVAAIVAVDVHPADGIVGVPAELFGRLAKHYASDPTPVALQRAPATTPDPPPAAVRPQEQLFVLPRKPHYA
jgi:hypothetical protein